MIKDKLPWLVPLISSIGIIFLALAVSVCWGATVDELKAKAFKIRVINDTVETYAYRVVNVKEPKVWLNLMCMEPMQIEHQRIIPGRYSYKLIRYESGECDLNSEMSVIDSGYFNVNERQLKKGYIIFLSLPPYDNREETWEGWR